MALTNDYPTIRPSLLLDFARAQALDPRITFTRATIATRVNEDGLVETVGSGVPRFDFDPVTLTSKGLLIEEQRTNYLLYSDDYNNGINTVNATTTANTVAAPNGLVNGATLTASAGAGQHGGQKSVTTIPASTTVTLSAYVKAGTHQYVQIASANVSNWSANAFTSFNIQTGQVISGTGQIQDAGNGWYRISAQAASNATAGATRGAWIFITDSSGNSTWTAAGTETVYVFGLSIEAGAFPTSYIPTTTASVQRDADVASMTGTNFSSWFNNGEGSFFVNASGVSNISGGVTRRFAEISDNTVTNRIVIGYNTTTSSRFLVVQNNAFQADITVATTSPTFKIACAYKVNDFQQATNGTLGSADTAGTVPVLSRLSIGIEFAPGPNTTLNGTISKLAYYPVRLTNAQLQALTRS